MERAESWGEHGACSQMARKKACRGIECFGRNEDSIMSGAPPPMQMTPLQFAQGGGGGDLASQLQALAKGVKPAVGAVQGALAQQPQDPGASVPGAAGPTSVGGAPLGAAPAQPSILDAIRGMSPPQIMDVLRNMSNRGQSVIGQGMPGS